MTDTYILALLVVLEEFCLSSPEHLLFLREKKVVGFWILCAMQGKHLLGISPCRETTSHLAPHSIQCTVIPCCLPNPSPTLMIIDFVTIYRCSFMRFQIFLCLFWLTFCSLHGKIKLIQRTLKSHGDTPSADLYLPIKTSFDFGRDGHSKMV